ncbi:MAG: IS1182 family transposase [Clostridia bacterium]|nr:IS1182 family transposase [Clostridia bacterium]
MNMSMTIRPKRQYTSEIVNLEEMIPQDHFLRIIDKYFDWNFIYEEVEKQYSTLGRPSIDPVVLFKIHILKFLFHEDSLRRTYENLKYNNLYRWFIGYELNEAVPDHSTYSQNYKRKFCKLEKDILQTVFDKVIDLLIEYNCLDMTAVYIDSTNTKAYANKKKNHKEIVSIEAKKYQKELEIELATKDLMEENISNEEFIEEVTKIINCNEEIETEKVIGTKEVIVSDTDKDAGMLYKNEKEKMFGYNSTVICENNNYILTVDVNPSNMHDSVAFYGAFEKFTNRFENNLPKYLAGDAAYITPHICKTLIDLEIIPCMPYKRPMTKQGYFKKYEYVYDEYNDIYICPNEKDLIPTSINKDGYMIYKASEKDCSCCPFKDKCTKMKYKQILRHVWEKYKEEANEYRYQVDVKEIYKQRSTHIERVYADGKMKHGLGKTYFRSKERVSRELVLLYACMNLKKFALHI